MKKVFALNGGAGRMICAIPALEKYYKKHGDNFYIMSESGLEFFLGNKLLQPLAFDLSTKGLFENYIKPNELITVEPYRDYGYYNQKRSLMEAFDFIINETEDHTDLTKPSIVLNKQEELAAMDVMVNLEKERGKKKTIVFQPFGRSATLNFNTVIDSSSRSITQDVYFKITKALEKDYNIIYFGDHVIETDTNFKVQAPLRVWGAIIEAADYFIGCDSVGQHMAFAFNKPGTIIMGSTLEKNVTYQNHFQILRKPDTKIVYSPIRIQGADSELADRYNDSCMDFSDTEVKDIINKILKDIKNKV